MPQPKQTGWFKRWLKNATNQAILWDSAMSVYEKADPKQKEIMLETALRVGALAAVNPDKAKQLKNAIGNLGTPPKASAQERIQELNELYKNKLISRQEYETKRAEILSRL